jgi:hypothetical protein
MQIEVAAEKFHWFQIAEDGVVELFLDHHSLSTFRMCEASFELSMMGGVKSKNRSWNLEFGIIWHRMVENFYIAKRDATYDAQKWLNLAIGYWMSNNMDEFEWHSMYKKLGGAMGFLSMCAQYSEHFSAEVERLRIIGVEITFGKKREVPLGTFAAYQLDPTIQPHFKLEFDASVQHVRCYLTGRIDFLMDSGNAIGPLDHKTTAFFGKGSPAAGYDPQEGMTGYIFATREILKRDFPELLSQRKVDRIWMNFATLTPCENPMDRFKRLPIFKTDFQLEQFRQRQLRTFHKIYDMVTLGEHADWNTNVCNNMFHSECQYKNLHKQNTSSAMFKILETDFEVKPLWNPENLEVTND